MAHDDEEKTIQEGIGMMNLHLEVNAPQSIYQVLTRAVDALSPLIVCENGKGEGIRGMGSNGEVGERR